MHRYLTCLLAAVAAILSCASAAQQSGYTAPITVPGWEGGAVDGNDDGSADFCQIATPTDSGGTLLALWTDRGLALAFIEPAWALDTENPQDMTLSVGTWSRSVTTLPNNPTTLVLLVGEVPALIDQLKTAPGLRAEGAPGAFDVRLDNGRSAFDQLEDCYLVNVAGLPPKYATGSGRTRTAKWVRYKAPRKVDDCVEYTDNLITFDFPVGGGEITAFERRFDIAKKGTVLSCMHTSSTSEFIRGHFDGGDGGAFEIEYFRISESGKKKRKLLAGQLWADGHGTATNPDSPGDTVYELTFKPF